MDSTENQERLCQEYKSLYIAIIKRDTELIQKLVNNNVPINPPMKSNNLTALEAAIFKLGDKKIVKLLLEKGAHVNGQSIRTPLHMAVDKKRADMVDILLEYNADATRLDDNDLTPIHIAAIKGYEDIIDIFLKHKVDINIKNTIGMTPLLAFLEPKIDQYVRDCSGPFGPILFISLFNLLDIKIGKMVDKFLINKASIDCVTPDEQNPLHLACRTSDCKMIENILKYNPDVNAKDKFNQTPFLLFCQNITIDKDYTQQVEGICESFIKLGADINVADSNGRTPLYCACANSNAVIVISLLKHKVKLNSLNVVGETPIYVAVRRMLHRNNTIEIVDILLDNNVDVNYIDKKTNNTILHFMAKVRFGSETMTKLVPLVTNINAKNDLGVTALHIALDNAISHTVKILLQHDVDINILNSKNQTTCDIISKHYEVAQNDLKEYIASHTNSDDKKNDEEELQNDDEYLTFKGKVEELREIITLFKQHIIKLKAAGLNVNSELHEYAYRDTISKMVCYNDRLGVNVPEFEVQCKEELFKLKEEKIGSFSLFAFLTDDAYKLGNFAENKEILLALKSPYYKLSFPIYIDIIRARFSQASKKHE